LGFEIEFDPEAAGDLKKLDRPIQLRLIGFLKQRIATLGNPCDPGEDSAEQSWEPTGNIASGTGGSFATFRIAASSFASCASATGGKYIARTLFFRRSA